MNSTATTALDDGSGGTNPGPGLPPHEMPPEAPNHDSSDAERTDYGYKFHEYKAITERRCLLVAEKNAATYAREIQLRVDAANAPPDTGEEFREIVLMLAKIMPQRATDTPNAYFDALATMAKQYQAEHGART